MKKLMAGVVAVAVAVLSVVWALRRKYLVLKCVGVEDGSNFAGREMMEMRKIRRHSGGESQRTFVLAENEDSVDVSDTGVKLRILVVVAVVKGLFVAKAGELMSRCHGLAPVVELALSVAVEKQDGPIRYQEVIVATQNRAAVEVGVDVEVETAAEAAARDLGRRDQACSSNL
jgi:hypothetical protein